MAVESEKRRAIALGRWAGRKIGRMRFRVEPERPDAEERTAFDSSEPRGNRCHSPPPYCCIALLSYLLPYCLRFRGRTRQDDGPVGPVAEDLGPTLKEQPSDVSGRSGVEFIVGRRGPDSPQAESA